MASRRALNPAFAAAHGLTAGADEDVLVVTPNAAKASVASNTNNSSKRLDLLLKEARASGKLQATNVGLKAPLPDALFDFRAGVVVDLSLEASSSAANRALLFGEETLTSVDLSDNDLSGALLDERVLRYEQVQVLRWKRCGLVGMQVHLTSLEQLAVLDLDGNQLENFRLDCIPNSLQELNLANNRLSTISSESPVKSLEYLASIDLSHNKLDTLDFLKEQEVSLPRLRSFHCHHNRLKALPCDSLLESSKNTLQILDVSRNQLRGDTAPLDLSNFTQLQTVLLSFNRLTVVPCIPRSVTRLDLTSNKIQSIQNMLPIVDASSDQASLMQLFLQDNHLTELDALTIAKCVELQRLDLSANKLKTLPYQLGFLVKLQHLSLTGNPLHTFKTSEMESTKAMMEKLRNRAPKVDASSEASKRTILSSSSVLLHNRTINLVGKKNAGAKEHEDVDLEQLVRELMGSPTLAFDISGQLLLDNNSLDSIPDNLLTQLPNVTELSLQKNSLKALPPSLATSCPHLTRLMVSGNHITQIDDVFSSGVDRLPWVHTLTHLDLSNNRLSKISGDVLKQLPNLQVLRLSYNKLTTVQEWYYLPPSLVQLDVSENSLEQVDDLILLLGAHCSLLEILLLYSNHIHRIPPTIGILQERCPNLKWLDLKGNPQRAIRSDILAKPTQDQLSYLMNRLTVEQKTVSKIQMEELSLKGTKELNCAPVNSSPETVEAPMNDNKVNVEEETSSTPSSAEDEETAKAKAILSDLNDKIAEFQSQLENPSLSQAKRHAVKKSLAMERSKLIREERKLGLRK
jgi:Leucine-rich repeat (LRR) protein